MRVLPLTVIIRAGAVGFAMLALGPGLRAAAIAQASFSGNNFEFPGFGPDGYKAWDVQGNQFSTTSADNAPVEIKNMKLHLYSGGPALALETTIESPQATVLTGASQAHGSDQLEIIGSNNTYQVTGFDWTWDGKTQVTHVGRQVHVLFTSGAAASANPPAKPSQPITINSDTLEIHQEPGLNRFLFSGNILVTDGDCQTQCNALEVRADRSATANPNVSPPPVNPADHSPADLGVGGIEHITASKNVVIKQGGLVASGDLAEFFPDDHRVELSGTPQVRESSSDILLEGGRIVWLRDRDDIDVEPIPDPLNGPGRVRVTLPPLASYQADAEHQVSSSESGPHLVITGESLQGHFGAAARRFDVEKSVRVEDPSLNVTADHLDAEFDPPAPVATASTTLLPGTPVPQVGRLNHLTTRGGVTIEQINRTTTTEQAEILPAKGEILLTGEPHVLDTLSHTTIDGNRIELSTDGRKAVVTGVAGQPAKIIMASLPGISDAPGSDLPTTIVSDTVTMERGDEYSNFTFTGRVRVTAHDLETTCGELDAFTQNTAPASAPTANALETTGQMGEIQELVAHDFVEITQRRAGATQSDFVAHAARADIYPQVEVKDEASDTTDATAPQRRSVELFGDPAGVKGPVRPEVELPPMQNLGFAPTGANAAAVPPANAPTMVTSDQQWLITGPAGSTYYFEGNVQIDGGSFEASCDKMRAEGAPAKAADGGNVAGPVVLERVIAEDHVRIVQGTRISTAGKAVLLPHEGKIDLTENVVVVNSADGSRMENADLELTKDGVETISAPAVPGQPLRRPSYSVPSSTMNFDNIGKPANKSSAGTSP